MKTLIISSRALLAALLLTSFASCGSEPASAANDLGSIDFRYSLPWWQTAICLPDDPDKALVGREGQLLFDFGSGPGGVSRRFGISLQPDIAEGSRWRTQEMVSARAPIVRTTLDAAGVEVVEETFVLPETPGSSRAEPLLVRVDGHRRQANWAQPKRDCPRAFTGIDLTDSGRVLKYELRAVGPATIAFGLCEGWHKAPGKRPLVLSAEGALPRTVDPVKDFGHNQPGIYTSMGRDTNGDGVITITVTTPDTNEDRNAILNALWAFSGAAPSNEEILSGRAQPTALASYEGSTAPPRRSLILVRMRNQSTDAARRTLILSLRASEPVLFTNGAVLVGASTRITCSDAIARCAAAEKGRFEIAMSPVELKPGEEHAAAITVDRRAGSASTAVTVAEAKALRAQAEEWWSKADLPYETIQVPDPSVQAMIESSVRNIWQAREIKGGRPAFHVGPTVYRGLWVVDGSFLLESAALLGRGRDARAGVEYLLSHQKEDGSFEILRRFWKENGIVLWAAARHAMLTQDKEWLRSHWPALKRVVKVIQRMRLDASKDPAALDYALLPAGEIDGGISNQTKPEFSNTYWCLAGLKAAIGAAQWLGDSASAAEWQREFDDFYAAYRKAAQRNMLKDSAGHSYVPTMIGNADKHVPARGQWAFCHAVYPGQVFPMDDPLVVDQLAMLRATKKQGLVYDTGWMREGIWTYFASFYGHAILWEGQGREAAEVLYDFGRHASPLRVWREEQKPVGKGAEEVGDMPHNWASAEFIRLAAHLIEIDRGDELHLLEGFPREWARPGMVTRLNGVLTPFGPLHLTIRPESDGKSARIEMRKLTGRTPAKIVLHLNGLTGTARALELATDRDLSETIALN